MNEDLIHFKFQRDENHISEIPAITKSSEPLAPMDDETFRELRDVIYELSGIYYTESKKYLLEGRISKRVLNNKLKTYTDYVNLLKSPDHRNELNQLFDVITINETYFFRAEQQFEAFEKIIFPDIMEARGNHPNPVFRIWSSATSSGEEAYTLAMIINEKIKPLYPTVRFEILASDINNAVLQTAKQGIYKEYSVRNIPQNYLEKYFEKQGSTYKLSEDIKKMVNFSNINLYDEDQIKKIVNYDVIFCCNVLIYFDMPSKQQVVSYLYDSLSPGGILLIGYSESLHGVSKAFKLVHLPKALAYKKE